MDKKNVQNRIAKKGLTESFFCLDKKKLWSQMKRKERKRVTHIFCDF